ncbi:MAG: hypothetical protein IPJ89_04750 [Candidatus Iainarchaeum archaeon]|uniref:Uncharacterized protein n=1 Tax=Candidatus Iainarchaeum sp. TaxID=3101447 RepID=A0A7T9DJF0_9ARCH|nr:MAG: hypothetical protein IPJ89_04750 [Candidatus Diapherotrites archaeon]
MATKKKSRARASRSTKTRTERTTRTRVRKRATRRTKRTTTTRTVEQKLERLKPEHRERFYRAKRALRALRRAVVFPKAVIHAKGDLPEILKEIPDQALIEHWEALGELKQHGIEVRHTKAEFPRPHLLREIELNAPVSTQARHFASRYGLVIKEKRHPIMSSLERIFG